MEGWTAVRELGRGSGGAVFLCVNDETQVKAALKRFIDVDPDIQRAALREAQLLHLSRRHPNIVRLLDAFRSRSGRIYLLFEYVPHTLGRVISAHPGGLQPEALRSVAWQLLQALSYLHKHNVIHRDVKPQNVLITTDGTVKLCDFGFAKVMHPGDEANASCYVVTRWYRAPELLLNDSYGSGVDIWALGAVFVEAGTGAALLPGSSQLDQLVLTLRTFPPEQLSPRHRRLLMEDICLRSSVVPAMAESARRTLAERCPQLESEALDFAVACLQPDPAKRPTAEQLMEMPYFAGMLHARLATTEEVASDACRLLGTKPPPHALAADAAPPPPEPAPAVSSKHATTLAATSPPTPVSASPGAPVPPLQHQPQQPQQQPSAPSTSSVEASPDHSSDGDIVAELQPNTQVPRTAKHSADGTAATITGRSSTGGDTLRGTGFVEASDPLPKLRHQRSHLSSDSASQLGVQPSTAQGTIRAQGRLPRSLSAEPGLAISSGPWQAPEPRSSSSGAASAGLLQLEGVDTQSSSQVSSSSNFHIVGSIPSIAEVATSGFSDAGREAEEAVPAGAKRHTAQRPGLGAPAVPGAGPPTLQHGKKKPAHAAWSFASLATLPGLRQLRSNPREVGPVRASAIAAGMGLAPEPEVRPGDELELHHCVSGKLPPSSVASSADSAPRNRRRSPRRAGVNSSLLMACNTDTSASATCSRVKGAGAMGAIDDEATPSPPQRLKSAPPVQRAPALAAAAHTLSSDRPAQQSGGVASVVGRALSRVFQSSTRKSGSGVGSSH